MLCLPFSCICLQGLCLICVLYYEVEGVQRCFVFISVFLLWFWVFVFVWCLFVVLGRCYFALGYCFYYYVLFLFFASFLCRCYEVLCL